MENTLLHLLVIATAAGLILYGRSKNIIKKGWTVKQAFAQGTISIILLTLIYAGFTIGTTSHKLSQAHQLMLQAYFVITYALAITEPIKQVVLIFPFLFTNGSVNLENLDEALPEGDTQVKKIQNRLDE